MQRLVSVIAVTIRCSPDSCAMITAKLLLPGRGKPQSRPQSCAAHCDTQDFLGERLTTRKALRDPATHLWTGLLFVQADGAGKKGSVAAAASEKQAIRMAMGNGEPV